MRMETIARSDERPLPVGCDTSLGGVLVSVERILQQESVIVMDDPQSCIIRWQHAEWRAVGRQARLGRAADSSIITSKNKALFLSTRTV